MLGLFVFGLLSCFAWSLDYNMYSTRNI